MITENMVNMSSEQWQNIQFRCAKCGQIVLHAKSKSPIELHTFSVSGQVDYVINHKKCLEKNRGN